MSTRSMRVVLSCFVLVSVTPFVIGATKSSFWQAKHAMAPFVMLLYFAIVLALVIGRYRWAWVLLFLFNGAVAWSWPFDSHRFTASHLLGLCISTAGVLLLLSQPMCARLRRPVAVWRRGYEVGPG